jgi:two-component system sensor histidine kinase KdpD
VAPRLALGVIVLGLALATTMLAWSESPATAPARHTYFAPVLIAALRFGFLGGVLAGIAAVLLAAPFVLPDVELAGVSPAVIDALLAYPLLVLGGWLAGGLVTEARRHRERYQIAVETQRLLSEGADLADALARVRGPLAARLHAEVAIVVREGAALLTSGARGLSPGSLTAAVLGTGVAAFVADAGGASRPRRAFATPLVARGETIGVLAVERTGEMSGSDRATLQALGAHIGLGLENARLAAAQRRFNEELARRVAEATARAAAVDRAKSAFVATASHELRTPLTALQGFGELLATREFPPAEVRRLAGVIRAEAQRLARIVADLLDLARLERGLPPALRRVPLRVDAVVRAAVEVFGGDWRHRLRVDCDAGLPMIDADPDALDRILKNLVSNAIKYSPAGGDVIVSARAVESGVELAVLDAGPGIDADALSRVFEPYFRAPGTAAAVPGTGIGLAVVKSLVEAHGGTVRLASAPGAGTRASVVLPAV